MPTYFATTLYIYIYIYIYIPSNKVVLDKYIHSNIVCLWTQQG